MPTESPLTHEQTLQWISDHRAWRLARKTMPIWARALNPQDINKEFQTIDHVAQVAREGFWLCAGVSGEPWFQRLEDILDKYEATAEERRQFDFDLYACIYHVFHPKANVASWVAQVNAVGVSGFFIEPIYDPAHPLFSPIGGYVVREFTDDPYGSAPKDVWLVQQVVFESTYEFVG